MLLHQGALEVPALNRQVLMRPEWLGRSRAFCARETLRSIYPDVEVVAVDVPLTAAALAPWLRRSQVALGCRHNFPERFLLNRQCVEAGVPLVEAAMDGAASYVITVLPGRTPCLACLFPAGDPRWDPLGFPVLGAVAGTVGCLAALEAVKVLTGWGKPLLGRLLVLDLEEGETRRLTVDRDPGCAVCGSRGMVDAAARAPRTTAVRTGADIGKRAGMAATTRVAVPGCARAR